MAQEIDDDPYQHNISKWDWNTYDNYISKKLGEIRSTAIIKQFTSKYYPHERNPEYQFTSMVSDMRAICPMDAVAKVVENYFDSPVYRYVMTYTPVKNITMQNMTKNYAFGGLDMYSFFGSYDKISGYASVGDSDLTKYLRDVVSKFAKGQQLEPEWDTFPGKTNIISERSRVLKDYYKSDECAFFQRNGFFPDFAWMN